MDASDLRHLRWAQLKFSRVGGVHRKQDSLIILKQLQLAEAPTVVVQAIILESFAQAVELSPTVIADAIATRLASLSPKE